MQILTVAYCTFFTAKVRYKELKMWGFNRNSDLETNHLAVVAQACVCQNKKGSWNGVRVYRSRIQRDILRDDDPRDLEIRVLLSCLF